MSLTTPPESSHPTGNADSIRYEGNPVAAPTSRLTTKVTMPALSGMKRQGKPITALTAYDYATSRLVDEAGIDMILVGDSLAMVVLGHDNTLAVTVDEMLHHTRAVRRAVRRALVVADMPFGSYHGSIADGVANAVRFLKEAGAEAVKIEGVRVELVRALTDAEIPVVGHLGLTPQSVHRMGGYRVQAKTAETMLQLRADAVALADAGAGAIVLEGIPREVAAAITADLTIPTIGIGAGPDCDGQILVFHDILNMTFAPHAKFVRQYADAATLIRNAVENYREDVEHRTFPSDQESYHLPQALKDHAESDQKPASLPRT
jgi:3-methyl-2-oxobutanoate hydroxymethyltransferase